VRDHTVLRSLLGVDQTSIQNIHHDDEGLVVEVAPTWHRPRCGVCGSKCRGIHGHRPRSWRHVDLGGMKVHLSYAIRRAFCRRCAAVTTEQVPWAPHATNFTFAFEELTAFFAQQCSTTFVANYLRISWVTVGAIVQRVVTRRHKAMHGDGDGLDGLRNIGVDELSYRRHHEYVTVVVDHDSGRIVWAAPGKNAETLKSFFAALGSTRSALLESVTVDLSAAYTKAIKEAAPKARIVYDRFHVQRLVQDALDETRRDEVRSAASPSERAALKGSRWALLKSPWNLSDADTKTLEELEQTNQKLFRGHLLKDCLQSLLNRRQVHVVRWLLTQWIRKARASGLAHFARAAATIEKHIEGILEYIRTRLNNGVVEGLNGKARVITRRSYGFHSAWALIAMLFLCCGGIVTSAGHRVPQNTH